MRSKREKKRREKMLRLTLQSGHYFLILFKTQNLRLINKRGFKSRAAYDGACTVNTLLSNYGKPRDLLGFPIPAPLFGKRIFWSVNAAWKGRELHVQFEKKSSVYSVLLSLPQRLVKMLSKSAHLSTIHYYAFYISVTSVVELDGAELIWLRFSSITSYGDIILCIDTFFNVKIAKNWCLESEFVKLFLN